MKKLIFILLIGFTLSSTLSLSQVQIGSKIEGENSNDESGRSIDISSDGSRVIIGARANDDGGSNAGHARVYQSFGSFWVQIGDDIDGEAVDDLSGSAVAMSSDGTRVAVGAPGNNSSTGHVRIFEYSGGTWVQLGSDIDGEATGDESGSAVSLSSDGSRVAIGAPKNSSSAGHVRVYEYSGGTWSQLGSDIDGEATGDESGSSISLSSDGSRVAIGALLNDGSGGNSGHARIYNYDGSSWSQLGGDIDGEVSGDRLGSVSLSDDGSRLAVGAYANNGNGVNAGHVKIYDYAGSWIQIGSDINGEAAGDLSGWAVALSGDGTRVAIGAIANQGNFGQARTFELNTGKWLQLGSDVDGINSADLLGWAVALSGDGNELAVAGFYLNVAKSNAGHVDIYDMSNAQLPVELLAFTGIHSKNQTLLEWTTASELNNEGFEIQHSIDGKNWNNLSFIQGYGTTNDLQYYQYVHRNAEVGMHYYRLKQIDYDDNFELSKTIAIQIRGKKGIVGLYPNPAVDYLTITNGEGIATIYNQLGQKMRVWSIGKEQSEASLLDLNPGQYILSIRKANGLVKNQRFIKQ